MQCFPLTGSILAATAGILWNAPVARMTVILVNMLTYRLLNLKEPWTQLKSFWMAFLLLPFSSELSMAAGGLRAALPSAAVLFFPLSAAVTPSEKKNDAESKYPQTASADCWYFGPFCQSAVYCCGSAMFSLRQSDTVVNSTDSHQRDSRRGNLFFPGNQIWGQRPRNTVHAGFSNGLCGSWPIGWNCFMFLQICLIFDFRCIFLNHIYYICRYFLHPSSEHSTVHLEYIVNPYFFCFLLNKKNSLFYLIRWLPCVV